MPFTKPSKIIALRRNNMKQTIKVRGMHCHSCEVLLEDKISALPGVKKAWASQKNGEIVVSGDNFDLSAINNVVLASGYELGDEKLPLFSHDWSVYIKIAFSFMIILAMAAIYIYSGLSKYLPAVSTTEYNLGLIFLVGVVAGLSTCMALVGGLVLSATVRYVEKHPNAGTREKFRPQIFFNLGRITIFALFGGMIGLIGSFFQLSHLALGLMTLFAALVMLFLGLQFVEISPKLSSFSLTLPKSLMKKLHLEKMSEEYKNVNTFILGGLTFFLPCGFTQAMQILAISTGSLVKGALIMGVFALGTTPGLLTVGGLSTAIHGKLAKSVFVLVGVLVILLGVLNFRNAINLMNLDLPGVDSSDIAGKQNQTTIQDGFQLVQMTETATGYKPNVFTVKKGIPVRWEIEAADISSCASFMLMPQEFNGVKMLRKGQNTIEFTPSEVGQINFSCSMGMYNGSFTVVE